ncbi:MAG: hypothetical protein Q8920_10745 [Bacillota bacterium]|nr:hypothetical protein [Bacillota bacterium]
MSVKPIDFQIMIPRTTEVARISNDEQQRNLALHQQQNSMMQQKVESTLTQVQSQEKAQEARIKEKQEKDRENRNKNKGQGNQKEENKKEENKKSVTGEKSSFIDIRL